MSECQSKAGNQECLAKLTLSISHSITLDMLNKFYFHVVECWTHFHKRKENDFFTWVSLGIYLLWSVSHSFHRRNKNDFCTWVSLGILLLCSVYHIFHKRNENEFSTRVSLGIFLLWGVNHSFHKRNENDFSTSENWSL